MCKTGICQNIRHINRNHDSISGFESWNKKPLRERSASWLDDGQYTGVDLNSGNLLWA